ncbi:MAG TPA: ThiF family adenylyltransferase [Candidatus Nitrosotalea sp.]|nr:ThiF family adenylyltransferase [Candidatus Nitrosotalea sp.]
MSHSAVSALATARGDARARAEAELQRLGFVWTDAGWVGSVSEGQKTARVTIRLPEEFPDVLPNIVLQDPLRAAVYAHVERTGKLCLAPPTGTLIDEGRPEQLIVESIERARRVLFLSDATHEEDLKAEFLSYWPEPETERVFSICPAPVSMGPIAIASLDGSQLLLAAPDRAAAERWASRVGKRLGQAKSAFAIALKELFRPPRFTDRITLAEFFRMIHEHAGAEVLAAYQRWLNETGLPAYVLVSAPLPSDGHIEIAALIREATGKAAPNWQDGFRPGNAPRSRQVAFARGQTIARLDVQRLDPAFVVERGGGATGLINKTVVVIGCGAVGSHAAVLLAATGIGKLRLIDPERLGPENVHRHVLGTDQIGQLKVDGLEKLLYRRYPLMDITSKSADVLAVLRDEPDFLMVDADAIVVAVGDETIERRLNRLLPRDLLRVHVWLEPLGLGGQTLAVGFSRPGCYECLYRLDDEHGLVNMASLTAPDQFFQRTIAGCGGTFTPFGPMDAERAAVEAVRTVSQSILDQASEPLLQSWVNAGSSFATSGHQLSPRGAAIEPGCMRRDTQFALPACPVCARW